MLRVRARRPCDGVRADEPCVRRVGVGIDGEIVEPDDARVIAPQRGEEAGLEGEQREAVLRPHAGFAERLAGAGVQSGRQVHGEHGAGQCVEPVDHLRHGLVRRAARADAEQRVDGEVTRIEIDGSLGGDGHAGRLRACQRIARVVRQALGIADEAHLDALAGREQVHRRVEAVATVVARTGGNPDLLPVRRDREREPGDCEAGAPHQRVRGQRRGGAVFDVARAFDAEQRQGARRRQDSLHRGQALAAKAFDAEDRSVHCRRA